MHKVHVWAEVSDDKYRAYEDEAHRRKVKVETLVQQTVNSLLRELEEEEKEGPDRILPA